MGKLEMGDGVGVWAMGDLPQRRALRLRELGVPPLLNHIASLEAMPLNPTRSTTYLVAGRLGRIGATYKLS